MERINEFKNSAVAQAIAAEKRDLSDRKITVTVTTVVFIMLVCAFKHAIGN